MIDDCLRAPSRAIERGAGEVARALLEAGAGTHSPRHIRTKELELMATRNRAIHLMGMGAAALSLFAAATPADADSRRHVFKPDQNLVDGITRDSAGGNHAPEIDPAAIGLGIALAVGGLAILTGRRRSAV